MALTVALSLNDRPDASGAYVTWAPSPCKVRVVNADGRTGTISVTLRNAPQGIGKVQFRSSATGAPSDTLTLNLAASGTPATCFVSGRFGTPSVADRDAIIEIREGSPPKSVGAFPLMVRIRKNATALTPAERGRLLTALAVLNTNRTYQLFRDIHIELTQDEAHGLPGFFPWHRIYLLDLERELQNVDPSVTMPYWKFDRPAPALFAADYLGAPDAASPWARFLPSNPLATWKTENGVGIRRQPRFGLQSKASVIDEATTLGRGSTYLPFWGSAEADPHGSAHTSFDGDIRSISTAVRDPLFFLLHCNVDRLWAKWQRLNNRFTPTSALSYSPQGAGVQSNSARRIGHCSNDTMWPWNAVTGGLRPPTAPRTPLRSSPCTPAPGPRPTVGATVDYQGRGNNASRLGFDYDDVTY